MFLWIFVVFYLTENLISFKYVKLRSEYEERWFETKVDHFGYKNNDKFMLRYLYSNQYYKPGGPIFFYCGNEDDITTFSNNTGFIWYFAPLFGATIIFAEHRYYGKSLPYKNFSKDFGMLDYLTVEQAMFDFIDLLSTLFPGRKVIAIGGSYGGMLAAWMRGKYPEYITGALASSAPIYQFEGLSDCSGPYEVITAVFKKNNKNSPDNIKRMWTELIMEGNIQYLWKKLNLCQDQDMSAQYLMDSIVGILFNIAMMNYQTKSDLLIPLPPNPVSVVSKMFSKENMTIEELEIALSQTLNMFFNYTGTTKDCLDLKKVDGNIPPLIWNYQSCTELSLYMCSRTSYKNMFPQMSYNRTALIESCMNQFGVTPDPTWLPRQFNVRNMSSLSNIIFSSGEFDPWVSGCVTEDINESVVAISIKGGAHHSDLRAISKFDSPSLVEARKREISIISNWLKNS